MRSRTEIKVAIEACGGAARGARCAMITAQLTTPKKKRISPTEREVSAAALLGDEALLALSVRALHALNRRAKEKRDRADSIRWSRRMSAVIDAIRSEIDSIYTLKTAFLDRVVRSGVARVEAIDVESRRVTCHGCGRSWVGDSWCHACCDDTGEHDSDTWYIVECQGHRFHQPPSEATAAMRSIAQPGEPHDPTQPARETPDVGLTIEAQYAVVRMMRDRLVEGERRAFQARARFWFASADAVLIGGAR